MLKRIVPFLFLALALQQAVALCACRMEAADSDAVALNNCSQWGDKAHDDKVLNVVGVTERPCKTHLQNIPHSRTNHSSDEMLALAAAQPMGALFDLPSAAAAVSSVPISPEFCAPAVSLPLLN